MFQEGKVVVLNGGLMLQELTADEMFLRRYYFSESGIPVELDQMDDHKTLIQFCEDTRVIVISRENLFFKEIALDRSSFDETISQLKGEVCVPEN